MGKLLSPEELEGAKPLLTAEDLEGSAPVHKQAIDKKTGLPLVSPRLAAKAEHSSSDNDISLGRNASDEDPDVRLRDVGLTRFVREVFAPSKLSKHAIAALRGDSDAIREDMERFQPGAAGLETAATKTVGVGINALSNFAKSSGKTFAERVADALGKTTEHSLAARAIQLALPGAVDFASPIAKSGVKVAAKVAPAAPAGAGEVAKRSGVMSNAIDRLRASPSTNLRAQQLLSRINALSKNAGTGAVTQSTLGAVNE